MADPAGAVAGAAFIVFGAGRAAGYAAVSAACCISFTAACMICCCPVATGSGTAAIYVTWTLRLCLIACLLLPAIGLPATVLLCCCILLPVIPVADRADLRGIGVIRPLHVR